MHKSSRNCHQLVVDELLNYVKLKIGKIVDFVNVPNDVGESSLHLVTNGDKNSKNGDKEDLKIVQSVMENGADVFMQTKEVETFLTYFKII